MKRQCARVYAEQGFPTYNFDTSIREVECIMRGDNLGSGDRFFIEVVSDGEIRHSSNAG